MHKLKRYQKRYLERARKLGFTESDNFLLSILEETRKSRHSRRFARFCNRFRPLRWIARFIWGRQTMACKMCGALVGMNSVIWRPKGFKKGVMTCWKCHDEMSGFNEKVAKLKAESEAVAAAL